MNCSKAYVFYNYKTSSYSALLKACQETAKWRPVDRKKSLVCVLAVQIIEFENLYR